MGSAPTAPMSVRVNDEPKQIAAGASLLDLLGTLSLDPSVVVVELNRVIVRRPALGATRLSPDDEIELVHFVGGG